MTLILRKQKPVDEKQLTQRVAKGDKEAFETIYEQTYGKVARYVKGFVKNESTAEDVIIQTYTIAWQNIAGFRGDGRLTTWLIGIARNIAFKEFRKNQPTTQFDESYSKADEHSHREPERKDSKKKLKDMIQRLSTKHKEILELVFFQGLTYPEISDIIGIPVNTVKTRVFHAKKALKDELSRQNITANDI